MTQQNIVKEDTLQRISSAGFIIGAILVAVSGLMMPRAANSTSDLQEMLKPLGQSAFRTTLASLLLTIGFWAVLIGVMGVYRSIATNGAVWARLGMYFTLIGTVLWSVSIALDIATAETVARWLSVPVDDKPVAWSVVAMLSAFGHALLPLTWIVYWLALVFLNIAMLHSAIYPRWLGWAGLLMSLPTIALGIMQIFVPRTLTLTFIFSILMLLTTLWNLAIGIWVARKAW